MVYVPGCSLEGPGFHSRKGQFFACQFLSIVAQIFAFLVLLGLQLVVSLIALCNAFWTLCPLHRRALLPHNSRKRHK